IPKGAAKQFPTKTELTEEEYKQISEDIGAEILDAKDGIKFNEHIESDDEQEAVEKDSEKVDHEREILTKEDLVKKYDLDNYDEEEGQVGIPVFGKSVGLTYHSSNNEDPYILLNDTLDDEEELNEMEILPTDNLILACKTEDDVSHLEILVYENEEDNLYVHHDIMLPSFPLCTEWLDFGKKGVQGNFAAIGTFEPEIEIWNLDSVDAIYPEVILGSTKNLKKPTTKKKTKKFNQVNDSRHVGAVTSISWNKSHRNLILTGSVDTTVKLWDLSSDTSTAVKSYAHHIDKVAAVSWNDKEPTVFLSGGYDNGGRVCCLDSRQPDTVSSWNLGSDVECIKWDPWRSERFLVSTEDGLVRCFDARNALPKGDAKPLYILHAHDSAVSSLDFSSHVDGLLVTGGADKFCKVWDIREDQPKKCIVSRDLGVGKVFAASFCVDTPYVLACTGSKGKIIVWNLENNSGVRNLFKGENVASENKKEIVEIEEEINNEDDEDDDLPDDDQWEDDDKMDEN
ncbi:hypothetical protein HK099_008437, partial [Clydaea vesicula]